MTLEGKKCASLPQLVQKLIKCPVKNCLLPFLYCRSCRSGPPTDSCKTHTNPCAQCFQIWQVSARYCTFLDFLAHCWLIFPSCTCELRIYVLMTSPTGYSLLVMFQFYQFQLKFVPINVQSLIEALYIDQLCFNFINSS